MYIYTLYIDILIRAHKAIAVRDGTGRNQFFGRSICGDPINMSVLRARANVGRIYIIRDAVNFLLFWFFFRIAGNLLM